MIRQAIQRIILWSKQYLTVIIPLYLLICSKSRSAEVQGLEMSGVDLPMQSTILARGCWYLSLTANQITPPPFRAPRATCWLAAIVCFPFIESGLCTYSICIINVSLVTQMTVKMQSAILAKSDTYLSSTANQMKPLLSTLLKQRVDWLQ